MKTGGRSAGKANKRTETRQMIAEIMGTHDGRKILGSAIKDLERTPRGGRKALDMLRELALLSMTCVAINQPKQGLDGKPEVASDDKLIAYMGIAARVLGELTQYEAPKLKAIMIQEAPPVPTGLPGDDAKVIGMMGKRSQQDAANAYLRLVRNDPKVA